MDRIGEELSSDSIVLFLSISVLLLAGSSAALNASDDSTMLKNNGISGAQDKEIKLAAHRFDPSLSGGGKYHIVQFSGPVKDEWKRELEENGVEIIRYIPENSFIIRTRNVPELPFIIRQGNYAPEYKVSSHLANRSGNVRLTVSVFENNDTIASDIRMLGGKVLEINKRLRVEIDSSRINDIAAIEEVEWIEEYVKPKLLNNVSSGIIGANAIWEDPGLNGTGQIIAVDDTGLDTGRSATIHNDFKGRIKAHFGYGRPFIGTDPGQTKKWDDPAGHGTHVSGSVLGSGSRSNGAIKGMAYNASLVIQSILDSFGNLGGLDVGINQIYTDSFDQGARIQSNSWGASLNGVYDSYAQDVDAFAWDHKDFVILFAAGNEGVDSNSDGIVDLDSLSSPGTSKNVITVGASENVRASGGYNPGGPCFTWGGCWFTYYRVNPIYSDRLSDNLEGMVAFSSRGPTDDGRIKPDIVAPGTNILSTKSSPAPDDKYWGIFDPYYAYNGGTSMSAPITAGAAALVRQYYTDIIGIEPSSALIKATMINTATNMTGQYSAPKKDVTGQPDNNQGWGRVNLTSLVKTRFFIDNTTGMKTGEYNETEIYIDGQKSFIATLVWTDYPGALAAGKKIVNDLDLTVTAPNGRNFYGNDFTEPYNTSYDATNNVEGVIIKDPVFTGVYKINISASNVPQSPQPFALVISYAEGRYINGTVMDSITRTGISGVRVSTNTDISNITDATGFYSLAVPSGTYDLTANYDMTYYTNNSITVSTVSNSVVAQDIELIKKPTGTISGSVTVCCTV